MTHALFRANLAEAMQKAGVRPDGDWLDQTAASLVARYGEPARAYHTATHIAAMLEGFAEVQSQAISPASLILAILFHDVVYNPHRNDNETASAAFAATALAGQGLAPQLMARVTDLIAATQHGAATPDAADVDCALLLDLDLAVLGGTPQAYRAYADAIRFEYAHVPDAAYRLGRAHVLRQFLTQPQIYRTAQFRKQLELRARENLAQEISQLDRGT